MALGVAALLFGIFGGGVVGLIIAGVIVIIIGFLVRISAEAIVQNAIAEAAADVAMPYKVTFDASWRQPIHELYRKARTESAAKRAPLDQTFQSLFERYLVERGHSRAW